MRHPLRHFQQTVDIVLREASDAAAMAANGSSTPQGAVFERAAENELYDRACDVLLAAQDLRRAASHDGTSVAIAASLGCVEETLSELGEAMGELGAAAVRDLDSDAGEGSAQAARLFGELRGALISSGSACGTAREAVGPALVLR